MLYRGCITNKRIIKENVYVKVEADSEEEALELLKEGNFDDYEDSEEIDDLGVLETMYVEIVDCYD